MKQTFEKRNKEIKCKDMQKNIIYFFVDVVSSYILYAMAYLLLEQQWRLVLYC